MCKTNASGCPFQQRRCRKSAAQLWTKISTLQSSMEEGEGLGWETQDFPSTNEQNIIDASIYGWPQRARPKSWSWWTECCSPFALNAHPHLFLIDKWFKKDWIFSSGSIHFNPVSYWVTLGGFLYHQWTWTIIRISLGWVGIPANAVSNLFLNW